MKRRITESMNIQKIPARKPDCAKTNGRPRIPAPIIAPESVHVVAQNFLFIVSP